MSDQSKLDFDRSVSTNLPNSYVVDYDRWAGEHISDRSKLFSKILRHVYEEVKRAGGFNQAPSEVIRRLRLDPA